MLNRLKRVRIIALLLTAMLILSGCAGPFGGIMGAVVEATDTDQSCFVPGGPGTATGNDNLERSFNYFVSIGYTPEMAAGIAGNLMTESAGATPWLAERGYASQWGWGVPSTSLRGWGIAQWTWGRHANVRSSVTAKLGNEYYTSQYSNPKAEDWLTEEQETALLVAQLEFLREELEAPPYLNNTYNPMRNATTPEQAADIFVRNFEVPANVDATSLVRQGQARDLYNLYTSGGSSTPPPASGTNPDPGSGGSDASTLQWSFPTSVPANNTSPYGPRLHPILGVLRLHAGMDLVTSGDKTLRAVTSGTVVYSGWTNGGGNTVNIMLDNGDGVKYLHLANPSPLSAGSRVEAGQAIGIMGTTGLSTGVHLHFEVYPKGKVDPNNPHLGQSFKSDNGLNGNTDTTDPAPWLASKGFNTDGSPNGQIPSDQYAGPGDGLNDQCAPGTGGTPGTPGMDMNPGPIPGFSAAALAASPYRRTDNETQHTGKVNSYVLSVFPEVPAADVFDYPSSPPSCHAPGNALDVMVPEDSQLGDTVAAWFQANHEGLGVSVLIWRQQVWSVHRADEGWRVMEDRGSITQNHRDHVHISFFPCVG